jgi:tetratricopeptide (TPR) repeat protein
MRIGPPALPALAAVLAASGSAEAAMLVIGGGDARACYEAAETRSSPQAGIAVCERALRDEALSRRNRLATRVNLGVVRIWAGEETRAIAEFDAVLAEAPALAEAKVNKAVALVRLNRERPLAIALLSEALAAGVSRPEVAHYARGMAHELEGNVAAAWRDYRRAAELRPGWAEPARQLQRFTLSRGQAAVARNDRRSA